jgi:hypothetical protein
MAQLKAFPQEPAGRGVVIVALQGAAAVEEGGHVPRISAELLGQHGIELGVLRQRDL